MARINFKVGDSVVVRPNVTDPDFNVNIGGWQGRISEISEGENLICIDWDSVTLKQMPNEMIEQSEEAGLDWAEMYLHPEEVELTRPRDSEDDVTKAFEFLHNQHSWVSLGEEGRRIQTVLAKAEDDTEWAVFEAWEQHFRQVMKFPFEARVSEPQERGPLRMGDKIRVLGMEGIQDLYGILVSVRRERREHVFPLCDLEVVDRSSSNYQPVNDYAVWFANR